jgi:hypothetical protein
MSIEALLLIVGVPALALMIALSELLEWRAYKKQVLRRAEFYGLERWPHETLKQLEARVELHAEQRLWREMMQPPRFY